MRRILFTILACTALFVAVPAAALAHNGRHHHKRHHHARVRHETFIAHHHASDVNGGSGSSTSAPTAGTVTSFDGTTLTITLNNGNTVSGAVTNDTEVSCESSEPADTGDDATEHSDMVRDSGPTGGSDDDQSDDAGDQGDQSGDDDDAGTCAITPGMAVRKAELRIDGSGASWDEVELISAGPTTTTQP